METDNHLVGTSNQQIEHSERPINTNENQPPTAKQHNSIQLFIERQSYGQGDLVRGLIRLTIVNQTAPDYLNIKLKAKEEADFQCEYKKKNAVIYGNFKGRLNWFNHKYPIRTYADNETLMPQVIEIPFDFPLDKNHPLSFRFFKEEQCLAMIQTKVKVEFKAKKKKKLKMSEIIQIVNTEKSLNESMERVAVKKDNLNYLQNCLCFGSGSMRLGIQIKKNIFSPSETISGTLDIDNTNSSLNVIGVRFQFIQFVQVTDINGQKGYFRYKGDDYISQQNNEINVSAGNRSLNVPFNFQIPADVEYSINQNVIKSTYELEVIALTDNKLPLLEPPSVTAVVWIYVKDDTLNQSQNHLNSMNQHINNLIHVNSLTTNGTTAKERGHIGEDGSSQILIDQNLKKNQTQVVPGDVIFNIDDKTQFSRPASSTKKPPQETTPNNNNNNNNGNLDLSKITPKPILVGDKSPKTTDQIPDGNFPQSKTSEFIKAIERAIANARAKAHALNESKHNNNGPKTKKSKIDDDLSDDDYFVHLVWSKPMYYHTQDKKLSYTKPVWAGNHLSYVQNVVEARLTANMNN